MASGAASVVFGTLDGGNAMPGICAGCAARLFGICKCDPLRGGAVSFATAGVHGNSHRGPGYFCDLVVEPGGRLAVFIGPLHGSGNYIE